MNRSTKRARLAVLTRLISTLTVGSTGRVTSETGYRSSPFWRVYDRLAGLADRKIGWHRVPKALGLLILIGVRNILRRENLYDTAHERAVDTPPVPPPDPHYRTVRTPDGTHNDLDDPAMGMAGSRFGRNVPIERTWPESEPALLRPNPRTVSRELLTREPFQPATTVNALVPAWLQFMIRDWFSHGRSPTDDPWEIEIAEDDTWPGERPMKIFRTRPDPTRPPGTTGTPPTYANTETHWWDASQVYGTGKEAQAQMRSGADGKLLVDDGRPPLPAESDRSPASVPGFWLGLVLMGTIFVHEHNAICDRLRDAYPSWSDDELFERARLVNAALIAKIHTVEWTPAVISHPTTVVGLRANWWGLAGERFKRAFGRLGGGEVLSGIPGTETAHYDVPYAITEEFVAVYRMHPLLRDEWSFRSARDDGAIEERTFREIAGPNALEVADRISMTDLIYSFGTEHPGLVTLHNFPHFLQEFERPDGKLMDLGAVDILRSRELGVPRYNEFRRLLHLPPAQSFEDLTDNPEWARQIRQVYDGDIEQVDLTVGMYAEPLPRGFAFSDTAFRIFALMASRRLNSDRFFTRDYRPEVYTPEGIEWLDQNSMMTVLLRHYPELRPALRGLDNAFWPWTRTGA
ncbi:MAG: heme peroxidase [Thermoleophilaceae bacterium]|nr:heme peroxidase [Thermoleophilaceae bacterium]